MLLSKFIYIVSLVLFLLLPTNVISAENINKQGSHIFVCPMHNHIQQDHSGHCPICGMDLVLNKEASEKISAVRLSKRIKETINVLTENVRRLKLNKEVYAGTILSHVEKPNTQIDIELLKPSLKWLNQGSLVEVEAKDYTWGVHTWAGEITHISDTPNPKTHAYPTSIKLQTPYGILKPKWYITLTFYGDTAASLVIPFKAVLFDADGNTHVIKVVGKNQYQTIPIKIGVRQDHLIQITDGLGEHDKVVTDGQFLINAEKQLQSGTGDMQ